jgi:hypothetical protein
MALASSTAEDNALQSPGGMLATATTYYLSGHTASPGTTGANEISGGTYARQAVVFSAPAAGSTGNTAAISLPIPASTTCAYVGVWTAVSGGTYLIGAQLGTAVVTGGSAGTATFAIGAVTFAAS